MPVTEMNKDTFWALIKQAKEHKGGPNEWLMERLVDMGPEQARTFDTIARVYMDLAYQYGLWTAASVMERGGCSDDGFIDFRAWLVGQGKDVCQTMDRPALVGVIQADRRLEQAPEQLGGHPAVIGLRQLVIG